MERDFSAEREPDVALTVKEEEPDVVGVPEIEPEEESVRPAGRVPEMSDQITPEEFAVSVVEYGVPGVAAGRLVVVIVRAVTGVGFIGLTVMESCFSAD